MTLWLQHLSSLSLQTFFRLYVKERVKSWVYVVSLKVLPLLYHILRIAFLHAA